MSSTFILRLGINYCIQDEDVAGIKALLVEPALHLAAIDKLKKKRNGLAAYVDAHKAFPRCNEVYVVGPDPARH
ncbi:hypothetical protein C8R43DRAFT_1235848 [Mycena crocata]|nr:hypothetical protein C8R43DRAFT_1235848 [Mycena crocata]